MHESAKEQIRCSNTGPKNVESSCECWRSSDGQRMVVDTVHWGGGGEITLSSYEIWH